MDSVLIPVSSTEHTMKPRIHIVQRTLSNKRLRYTVKSGLSLIRLSLYSCY